MKSTNIALSLFNRELKGVMKKPQFTSFLCITAHSEEYLSDIMKGKIPCHDLLTSQAFETPEEAIGSMERKPKLHHFYSNIELWVLTLKCSAEEFRELAAKGAGEQGNSLEKFNERAVNLSNTILWATNKANTKLIYKDQNTLEPKKIDNKNAGSPSKPV